MSFRIKIDPRRRVYVRAIGEIYRVLNEALAEESRKRQLTRKEIAQILGKNKSVVTRAFSGSGNMTLETLSDLAFALNRSVKISLPPNEIPMMSNQPERALPGPGTSGSIRFPTGNDTKGVINLMAA